MNNEIFDNIGIIDANCLRFESSNVTGFQKFAYRVGTIGTVGGFSKCARAYLVCACVRCESEVFFRNLDCLDTVSRKSHVPCTTLEPWTLAPLTHS